MAHGPTNKEHAVKGAVPRAHTATEDLAKLAEQSFRRVEAGEPSGLRSTCSFRRTAPEGEGTERGKEGSLKLLTIESRLVRKGLGEQLGLQMCSWSVELVL